MTYFMLIEAKTPEDAAKFNRELEQRPGEQPANRGMGALMSTFSMPTS